MSAQGKVKKSKNQYRREKAKQKKKHEQIKDAAIREISSDSHKEEPKSTGPSLLDNMEEVQVPEYYQSLFSKFTSENPATKSNENAEGEQIFYSDEESEEEEEEKTAAKSTSRKSKKNRIPLAELKAIAPKPELVEWYDANAPDPELVVQIKAIPGVVPVPGHWQLKREYLSSRRGVMKAPFDLPDYIKATGIMEMRDALKEDESTLAQKTRERVQPKMGRLDIDYQKLHDAIFKLQTKPRMYQVGEVYYESKESEVDVHAYRPGKLSQRLKKALNIPPGAPPPWLLSMQRYGPPASYPGLRIPGLNAPIPPGAQWGFQPGGYGRMPVDAEGNPLYGDVLGSAVAIVNSSGLSQKIEWGSMVDDYGQEDDEEDDESDDDEDENDEEFSENDEEGAGYVDEDAAIIAGRNSDRPVDNRRRVIEEEDEEEIPGEDEEEEAPVVVADQSESKPLYTVLEQKQDSGGFLGSQTSYHVPTTSEFQKTLSNLMTNSKESK